MIRITTTLVTLFFLHSFIYAQPVDSTQATTRFAGSIGMTNNGFGIIPTFSLNSPAAIINLSWRKNNFSIEPDIRLVPDGSKGGMLFWFRYRLVENKKLTLRVGVHPAFSFIKREVVDNGTTTEISEMLRFAAAEVAPNYQITANWSVGAVYLHGQGLQKHGPQSTDVLFLNTSIANLKIGGDYRLQFIPMVYFLITDGYVGNYFSTTGILSKMNFPLTLQSTINQTFHSNIPGNKDFMWNVTLNYNFSKTFKQLK